MESISPVRAAGHAVIAEIAVVYCGGLSLSHVRAAVVEGEAVVRMDSPI